MVVRCDARTCHNEREIEDYDSDVDRQITRMGWLIDPSNPECHYCPRCKPEVKKELEAEGVEFDD